MPYTGTITLTIKWDIFTSANFCKTFFAIEENFARQKFAI